MPFIVRPNKIFVKNITKGTADIEIPTVSTILSMIVSVLLIEGNKKVQRKPGKNNKNPYPISACIGSNGFITLDTMHI